MRIRETTVRASARSAAPPHHSPIAYRKHRARAHWRNVPRSESAGLALKAHACDAPESLLRVGAIQLDRAVFAYTLGLSILTGIVFGLAPAFAACRADLT